MTSDTQPPRSVVEQYGLDPSSIQRLAGGLINQSFRVTRLDGGDCVLQRVNSIFPAAVNDDIDRITRHLHAKGQLTPLIVPTPEGRNYFPVEDQIWRLLSRIEGETHERLRSDTETAEAGRILGRFHFELRDFDQPLAADRPMVHNIERHLGTLRQALKNHSKKESFLEVSRISELIFKTAATLQPLPASESRLVHGDPKVSNIVFNEGRAVCLIDLDTIARVPIALELGDALRSWCNPAGEDSLDAAFSLERFKAAIEGYRLGAPDLLTEPEWREIPDATLLIATELAARFAADALNESYFGWDRQRFESASQHNLMRATAQFELATSVRKAFPAMRELLVTMM